MIMIRKLQPGDDRMAVSNIYAQSWKHAYRNIVPQAYLDSIPAGMWAKTLDQPGRYTLVAELDGSLIGTSSYGESRDPEYTGWGEIRSIYLLPEYMGKGYGRELMKAVIDELHLLGYSDLFLWVLEENLGARAFYEKVGFRLSGDCTDAEIGGKVLREIRYHYGITGSTNTPV